MAFRRYLKSQLDGWVSLLLAGLALWLPSDAAAQFQIDVAWPYLSFNSPTDLQHAPDGRNRLFVVGG